MERLVQGKFEIPKSRRQTQKRTLNDMESDDDEDDIPYSIKRAQKAPGDRLPHVRQEGF